MIHYESEHVCLYAGDCLDVLRELSDEDQRDCKVQTATDGTPVRVQGSIGQEQLDALTKWVHEYVATRCHDESSHPMPQIAQRIHKRKHYLCGREKGHEGAHTWPDIKDDGEPAYVWGRA